MGGGHTGTVLLEVGMAANIFWDWSMANVSSVAQLGVSLAGFTLAVIQLWRTASASVESKKLLQGVRAHLLSNDLIVAIPNIHDLEDEILELSKDEARREQAERALVEYSRKLGELAGFIDALLAVDQKEYLVTVAALVKKTSGAVRRAKGELAQSTSRPYGDILKPALGRMSELSEEVAKMRAIIQKEVVS